MGAAPLCRVHDQIRWIRVNIAASQIAAGTHDIVIGGGAEHMGRVPLGSDVAHPEETGAPFPPELLDRYQLIPRGLSAPRAGNSL